MDPAVLREDMVDGLESPPRDVLSDDAVAIAMRDVPRHEFVDDERTAYADREHDVLGTRVLAPSTVARLFEALSVAELEGDGTVLIVGAGVGYTAAVAAELVGARNVHAVDIARPLVFEARENLDGAGYGEVLVDRRDGADGLPEYAPFDRILLEAAVVDPPRTLCEQLSDDGRLVFPRGTGKQRLEAVSADGERERFGAVSFDPLLIDGEQSGTVERNRTAREDREHAHRAARSRRGWEQEWIEWEDAIDG
ncbi:protein-L-isoaspartate O-methyltransferase family protein [Natrarchaeobius oligotrophus]|uniref:protein-L-isoaspartate(D-aspartate) O-methyltransferase n=1 Tax=Natrarchaeobius chitinivorans TaxID=1679083 RepID=A0A3N6MAH2_NATCH|nr:protein-L-isoaspartate O-methyltransferase [Natrarchaeobius chitinivorans]RQH00749.1 protein-L-isoaspartate O-methyltransferase [Natrarchaeobius chitinivorans]